MSENISPAAATRSGDSWEQVFEAALLERDPVLIEQRLQDAKDAIMDRIEDSFDTDSVSESRFLLAALNTITDLRRESKIDDLRQRLPAQDFGHAA